MVSVRAAPPVKAPEVIVTVNTPAAEMVAVPAPPTPPAVKVRVPGAATASPAPLSVMTILPVAGIVTAGVRDTVMMTLEAAGTLLLRVIAGMAAPSVLVTMATKVPDVVVSMRAPTELVVAAAMVVDAI
jgi:hypothetical protein